LSTGVNGPVSALAFDSTRGRLYVGGEFTTAGGLAANHIARWSDSAWSNLGAGADSNIHALALDSSGNLYAGGWGPYTDANGFKVCCVVKWDGRYWNALASGTDSGILKLVWDGKGLLYAGGAFAVAGDKASSFIGHWTTAIGHDISDPGTYVFYANNLPVTIVVPAGGQGDLARINIQRFDKSHPNATLPIQTDYYWQIEGLNANGGRASGYSVNLTFSTPSFIPSDDDKVCRYSGTETIWDCAANSHNTTTKTITRNGVTQFSDWAIMAEPRRVFLPVILRDNG